MEPQPQILAIFQSLGMWEMIVIGLVALLIFGRRLPEVGRSLGKSFVEFKKGLKDTGDEIREIRSDANKAISADSSEKADTAAQFNDPHRSDGNSN